jgi:uncharacterized damage-inducible protein DinB
MDMVDRIVEHDAWTMRKVLVLCENLTPAQLTQEFDIGYRNILATVSHIVGNMEIWTDLMAGRAVRLDAQPSDFAALLRRFEAASLDFQEVARRLAAENKLNDFYEDYLDKPPRKKSYGSTILHLATHSMLHRSEILHMLQRLGVPNLPEGDVLSWEQQTKLSVTT